MCLYLYEDFIFLLLFEKDAKHLMHITFSSSLEHSKNYLNHGIDGPYFLHTPNHETVLNGSIADLI